MFLKTSYWISKVSSPLSPCTTLHPRCIHSTTPVNPFSDEQGSLTGLLVPEGDVKRFVRVGHRRDVRREPSSPFREGMVRPEGTPKFGVRSLGSVVNSGSPSTLDDKGRKPLYPEHSREGLRHTTFSCNTHTIESYFFPTEREWDVWCLFLDKVLSVQ